MANYIYNMGLPILVQHEQLITKKKIKALSAVSKSSSVEDDESHILLQDNVLQKVTNPQQLALNKVYRRTSNNHRQMVIYADEIMSSPVISLQVDTLFTDAWRQFQQQKFRHFTVVNKDNKLVGIISERDMLTSPYFEEQQGQLNHPKLSIANTMIAKVVTATTKTSIREICQLMFRKHIGAVPIINDNGQVNGLITRSDILRTIIKNEPLEFWV
ncbi:MAG: CBS domain-containing protein [Alteromonadaceae bacterium]|nr:CBS domain-containing protein [Alteromonadaceae bacterium]